MGHWDSIVCTTNKIRAIPELTDIFSRDILKEKEF